jgi:hypothetical protein
MTDLRNFLPPALASAMTAAFAQGDLREAEIAQAQERHPAAADRLWHAFRLLGHTHPVMDTPAVYAAHCRELLDRVAAGADTRPGTAAEICALMRDTSLAAPLTSAAAGLYLRAWRAAGLPDIGDLPQAREQHEALESSAIDEYEAQARRRLAVPERQLGDIQCNGLHNPACVYAPANPTLF